MGGAELLIHDGRKLFDCSTPFLIGTLRVLQYDRGIFPVIASFYCCHFGHGTIGTCI